MSQNEVVIPVEMDVELVIPTTLDTDHQSPVTFEVTVNCDQV